MTISLVPLVGIILTASASIVAANLSLDFKVTKISASPANCNVANTTYAHGETFKLDCRTQCVCENGRHACSSLCPKEQLPAPEDTISCRSPRLVEVPGHCCKMWLCENPTADVYATCHNSSTSPWTPCSQSCGLGMSTRFTSTAAGCNQLINLRLCENRKCDNQAMSFEGVNLLGSQPLMTVKEEHHGAHHHHQRQHRHKHKMKKKSHECRHVEHLGPSRIRLGECVSRKLYRPKVCGHCSHPRKCCMPSLSTTIQVELLCPLNAADPISVVQQQEELTSDGALPALTSLWDTSSLDGIDQEYYQSRQMHIQNKFIAIEWILKCECSENKNCRRRAVELPRRANNGVDHNDNSVDDNADNDGGVNENNSNDGHFDVVNIRNNNYFNNKNNNDDDDLSYFRPYGKTNTERHGHLQHFGDDDDVNADDNTDNHNIVADNDSSPDRIGHKQHTRLYNARRVIMDSEETVSSMSASSDETQPDIIPYPPPPFTTDKGTANSVRLNSNNSNGNKAKHQVEQTENVINESARNAQRQQQLAKQEKYFYEQWLLQQEQQKRQNMLLQQLWST
uniref:VWFC domain-containing protein n=1 Tax=Musca domestica TaxID=7370 RepID=A0A1I8MRL8_MUSDO